MKKMIFGAVIALAMFVGLTQADAALIHDAAGTGDVATVLEELNNGVDVNAKTKRGLAPIMIAAMLGQNEVVAQLLHVPGIDVNAKDTNSLTPLMLAVRTEQTAIVEQLLNAPGIDINTNGKHGTALTHAVHNSTAVVERLLNVPDIDVNARDQNGITPLMHAAVTGHIEIVELLLNAEGVDINAHVQKNGVTSTALMGAIRTGHTAVAKLLLNTEGIDVKDALMVAVRADNTEIVKQLLLADADITVEYELIHRGWIWNSKSKYTALQYAQKHGYTETAKAIEDYMNAIDSSKTKSARK